MAADNKSLWQKIVQTVTIPTDNTESQYDSR